MKKGIQVALLLVTVLMLATFVLSPDQAGAQGMQGAQRAPGLGMARGSSTMRPAR